MDDSDSKAHAIAALARKVATVTCSNRLWRTGRHCCIVSWTRMVNISKVNTLQKNHYDREGNDQRESLRIKSITEDEQIQAPSIPHLVRASISAISPFTVVLTMVKAVEITRLSFIVSRQWCRRSLISADLVG